MTTDQTNQANMQQAYSLAGLFTLALRLVVGWTYFSAFWRRLVLENKLDPDAAGYIGEKFNNFLPNALGIKPMIEFLVSNPDWLWWAMVAFTIIEGIVGLLFMFGFLTRLMSLGVLGLATGILLGSGWLGTTCLDEWQIGILGMAAGFTIFLSGGGQFSVDNVLQTKVRWFRDKAWFSRVGSGMLPWGISRLNRIALSGAVVILFMTLFTNQYFHNGVWGKLHNKSIKPIVEISDARLSDEALSFTVYRVEGVDVYGSFLIGVSLKDADGKNVFSENGEDLSQFPEQNIRNSYVARVEPGAHSLIIPLGSKARLTFDGEQVKGLEKGLYELVLTDISGATWKMEVERK